MADVQLNGPASAPAGAGQTEKPKTEKQLKKEAEKEAKRLKFLAKQEKQKEQQAQKLAKQKDGGEEVRLSV